MRSFLSAKHALFVPSLVLASTAAGCSFSPPDSGTPEKDLHQSLNAAPIWPIDHGHRYTVQEVPGKMKLMHGFTCANAEQAAGADYLGFRVQESVEMPAGYTGTVFLNGFRADYAHGDRNMLGLGASILNVEANVDLGELRWEAGGELADASGDDAYQWCYWYGIALWNTALPELDIEAFQSDADPLRTTFMHHHDSDPGNGSALRNLPGAFISGKGRPPKAVLPRGFGLVFSDGNDYNLLQEGFNLGLPQVSGTQIEWTAQTVFKDNDKRRDYRGSALVSFLLGSSVQVWQPEKLWQRDPTLPNTPWEYVPGNDFELVSRAPVDGGCIFSEQAYREHEYLVENVPFEYALPVLAGWENGNACGDSNVLSTGVFITDVSYEKQPGSLGKLRYIVVSNFEDDGGWFGDDGNLTSHNVVVLGFNELSAAGKGSKPAQQVSAPLPTQAHK